MTPVLITSLEALKVLFEGGERNLALCKIVATSGMQISHWIDLYETGRTQLKTIEDVFQAMRYAEDMRGGINAGDLGISKANRDRCEAQIGYSS